MGFNNLKGKKVVWQSAITQRTDADQIDTFIVFDDLSCMFVPDADSGEAPTMLEDPKKTLSALVAEEFAKAVDIVDLAERLQHPLFLAWVKKNNEEALAAEEAVRDIPSVWTTATDKYRKHLKEIGQVGVPSVKLAEEADLADPVAKKVADEVGKLMAEDVEPEVVSEPDPS